MTEKEALSEIPGMIALNCPHCGAAKLVRRMQIDPPQARLAFSVLCSKHTYGKSEVATGTGSLKRGDLKC